MDYRDEFNPRIYVYHLAEYESLGEWDKSALITIIEKGEFICRRCQRRPEPGELSNFIDTRLCARCDHMARKDD